jgi:hypothetical protein
MLSQVTEIETGGIITTITIIIIIIITTTTIIACLFCCCHTFQYISRTDLSWQVEQSVFGWLWVKSRLTSKQMHDLPHSDHKTPLIPTPLHSLSNSLRQMKADKV